MKLSVVQVMYAIIIIHMLVKTFKLVSMACSVDGRCYERAVGPLRVFGSLDDEKRKSSTYTSFDFGS